MSLGQSLTDLGTSPRFIRAGNTMYKANNQLSQLGQSQNVLPIGGIWADFVGFVRWLSPGCAWRCRDNIHQSYVVT